MTTRHTPDRYTLLARKAVAEVNKSQPHFVKLLMDGKLDRHWEMKVALKAVELAIEGLVRPEDVQTMMGKGIDGCTVAKTKDGGLTWTHVPYEDYKAATLSDTPLELSDRTPR